MHALHNCCQTHILRLKHVAYHLVLALAVLPWVRGLHILLRVGSRHPAPGHQDHYVADVCDVGDGPQRVVHHGLLVVREA